MFNDLFSLVNLLDHDFCEENGKQVHSCGCRRCQIAIRLKSFKESIRRVLTDIDFEVGDSVEAQGANSNASNSIDAQIGES